MAGKRMLVCHGGVENSVQHELEQSKANFCCDLKGQVVDVSHLVHLFNCCECEVQLNL